MTAIAYCSDATAQGRAAGRLADELACRLAGRSVPLPGPSRGGRHSARRLAAMAGREEATLLVVPVEERGALGSALRNVADVIRLAACPVVLVPPRLDRAGPTVLDGDHVLWAVRDHRDAGCADVAAGLAHALELPLTIAHVMAGDSNGAPGELSSERLSGWLIEGILDSLSVRDRELAGRSSVRISSGEAGPELRRLCEQDHPALIAMGSRGRGPLAAAVLGSICAHLARHGTRPIVVCPPETRQPRHPAATLLRA